MTRKGGRPRVANPLSAAQRSRRYRERKKVVHGHKLICGDCVAEIKKLASNSINLTITSPPYGTIRAYHGYSWDWKKFTQLAQELYCVTKSGGVVVWVSGDQTKNGSESGDSFRQALYFKTTGFLLYDTMIFATEGMNLKHRRYEQSFQYMFIFSKGKPKTFNPLMIPCKYAGQMHLKSTFRRRSDKLSPLPNNDKPINSHKIKGNIWYYRTGYNQTGKGAFFHPSIFPEGLAADHISSWSNPNDLVFDPFVGSGTTGKMAILAGRNFIGIDCSSEYIFVAERRLKKVLSTLATNPYLMKKKTALHENLTKCAF